MRKKLMTLGLLVILLGAALAYRVLDEQKEHKLLVIQQQQRFGSILEKLAAGITDVYFFDNINASENCQQQLSIYNQQRAERMWFFTAAVSLMLTGILISACSFSLYLTNVIFKLMFICLKPGKSFCLWLENMIIFLFDLKDSDTKARGLSDKNSKLNAASGWNNATKSMLKMNYSTDAFIVSALNPKNNEKIAVLLSDEKTAQLEKPDTAVAVLDSPLQAGTKTEPVHDTLKNLAEQVSAIRQYAANQQEKVTKLQEGYDWNITRTFCLRIIRCIDNIETRIAELEDDESDTGDLEQIKDELIFALESSGVEQFEPKLNSDYIGQEKFVEAAKEKEHCQKPELKGKIARVLRPGYQYIIDDENVKVVRTAQVRLFGDSNK